MPPALRRTDARPAPRGGAGRAALNAAALVETALFLTAAALAIRWAPFRRVLAAAGWGARHQGPVTPAMTRRMRRLRWAVERWTPLTPWRTVCFQRGLALHWMLRRRGIPSFLHYGIARGNRAEPLSAHVWLTLGGEVVMGGEDVERHACVAVRPSPAAR